MNDNELLLPPMYLCPLNVHLHETRDEAIRCCHIPTWHEILSPFPPSIYKRESGKHLWHYKSLAKGCCTEWIECLAPPGYGHEENFSVDVLQMVLEGHCTAVVLVRRERQGVIEALKLLLPFERREWPPTPKRSTCYN